MADSKENLDSAAVRNLKRDADGRIPSGDAALSALQHEATLLRNQQSKDGQFSAANNEQLAMVKKQPHHDGYVVFAAHPHFTDNAKKQLPVTDDILSHAGAPKTDKVPNAASTLQIDNPFVDQRQPEVRTGQELDAHQLPFSAGKPGLLNKLSEQDKARIRKAHGDVPVDWSEQHQALINKARSGVPDTAFFGDSITDGMQLNNDFRDLHGTTASFGIHSDTTENLRYRLEHGELDFKGGKAPKTFVMLIGTNDIDAGKAHPQIARDVMGNAELIAHKFPDSKVLVLGLLPRGGHGDDVADINKNLEQYMRGSHSPNLRFKDVGRSMLEKDGSMSREIWGPDFEHPTYRDGYSHLLGAIKKTLDAEN